MIGYLCPCCGNLICTAEPSERRTCPHCRAQPSVQFYAKAAKFELAEQIAAWLRADSENWAHPLQAEAVLRSAEAIERGDYLASAIEAASAGETPKSGSTEGESAAPNGGDAHV